MPMACSEFTLTTNNLLCTGANVALFASTPNHIIICKRECIIFTPFLLLLFAYNITRHGFGLFLVYVHQCFVKIYKCAQWTQFQTAIVRLERYYVLAYVLNIDECT